MNGAAGPEHLRPGTPSSALVHDAAASAAFLSTPGTVWPGAALHGPAFPVRQSAGSNLWLHRALYAAPAGSVLVVTNGDPERGYFGELMARTARRRGLAGLVTDGGVRDVAALEALAFPVFAAGTSPRGTSKDPEAPGGLGRSVSMDDVRISEGDLVVGDRDGVVVVPHAELFDLADRVEALRAREEGLRSGVDRGERLLDLVLDQGAGRGSLVTRLARLDTPAVSDALDRLGLDGAVDGFTRWGPATRVAGRAVTVRLEPGPARSDSPHLGTTALTEAAPDQVIVVANGGRAGGAAWGGLLTLRARLRGVAGVVVDGLVRDVDEVEDLGVPVLARGATPRTARSRFHEAGTDVPVDVEGIRVEPGGLVLADGSGVVFIPSGTEERVLTLGEEIADREAEMAAALRHGGRPRRILGSAYEEMLRQPADQEEE